METNQLIEQWLVKLRAGTLVDEDLQQALNRLNDNGAGATQPQRLLYLQTRTTGVDSEVLGMALVDNGQILEAPDDPADWPYETVLKAMADGWRVVKFPELALLLQEDKTYGFGCEFILEK